MRDPNRIPKLMFVLEEAWKKNPDMRLGQLVSNATLAIYQDRLGEDLADPFSIEDEELIAKIAKQAHVQLV